MIFGHIHESHGVEEHSGITFVNASSCSRDLRSMNAPVIIDL
jgi:Icc-related predicted phosphoesterase